MIQSLAVTVAHVKRGPVDFFVIVQRDSGASTASSQLALIARYMHVRKNKFALQEIV